MARYGGREKVGFLTESSWVRSSTCLWMRRVGHVRIYNGNEELD